jgi:hypothetical protein
MGSTLKRKSETHILLVILQTITRLANSLEDAKPHLRPPQQLKIKRFAACRNARRKAPQRRRKAEAIL